MSIEGRSIRGLVGVLSASAASLTANRLLSIAVPWLVLSSTHSAADTGLVVFAQLGPYVLSQALSGPLIDRVGPRRISVGGDLISASALAVAPLLYAQSLLPLGVLMSLMAVVGFADGPSNAAKGVFIPSVTRAARVPLERGTGLSGAVERAATTVGPAAAGVVVAVFGSIYALAGAAVLCLVSSATIASFVSDPLVEPEEQSDAGYLARLREGIAFLGNERLLRAIVGMVAVTNLLDQAFMAVLLPLWTRSHGYGPEVVGLLVSVFGATSVVASLAAAVVGARLPRRAVYLIGFVIGGVPRFAAMGLGPPLWVVIAVFGFGGLGSGFINPIVGAIIYERIPSALLGRVRTLTQACAWAGIPFGGLFGAAVTALAGLTGTLWIVGGCYLVAIVIPGLRMPASSASEAPTSNDEAPPAEATRRPAFG